MLRLPVLALLGGLVVLSGGVVGQDAKKDDTKAVKKEKDASSTKVKGVLPMNWGKIGLSDSQKQDVYKVQSKYNGEIDKLELQIKDLKSARDKEMKAILTAEQKKRLEEILSGKAK